MESAVCGAGCREGKGVVGEKRLPGRHHSWSLPSGRKYRRADVGDIQGTLSREERLELAGLTQVMREHVDTENNLPFEGAKKLHRYLTDLDSDATGSGQ